MADFYSCMNDEQAGLIENATLFVVATADPNLSDEQTSASPVNVSPKGGVPFHIVDRNRVTCLDYAGSDNETAGHSITGGPITVMVCTFEQENAAIVRLYGKATVTPIGESPSAKRLLGSPAEEIALPERRVIDSGINRNTISCGYGVAVMSFKKQRTTPDRGSAATRFGRWPAVPLRGTMHISYAMVPYSRKCRMLPKP